MCGERLAQGKEGGQGAWAFEGNVVTAERPACIVWRPEVAQGQSAPYQGIIKNSKMIRYWRLFVSFSRLTRMA